MPGDLPIKKVLIIDDEPLILKTTALLLKKAGVAAVLLSSNGLEGLDIAAREKPDLILLDITMPEPDGWQVLEKLKVDPVLASIPVIVFTANDYSISDNHAKENGAAGVCRKPFQTHQLLKIVQQFKSGAP